MNQRSISSFFSILLFLICGLYVVFDVVTEKASSIGTLYTYLSATCFVLAILKPRTMFFVAVFFTCYIDLLKRLMVIGGLPTEIELAFFQAIPMLIILGVSLSQVIPIFLGRRLSAESTLWLVLSGVLCVIFVLSGGSTGSLLRKAGQAANMGLYSLFLFVSPLLLKNVEDRLKYLRFSFYCFVPVALYMFKHYFYGLADFEYDYLMTGLSQEIRIFTDDGDARRYFSTLNSAATVSTMLSIMALFGFINFQDRFSLAHRSTRFLNIFISFLFLAAASLTLARTGWVCGLVSLTAYWFFGSKFRIAIGYILAAVCLFILLSTAEYILIHRLLDDWQANISRFFGFSGSSVNAQRALVLGTMYDRISGWRYLATQPFGFPLIGTAFGGKVTVKMVDGYMLSHDLLVGYLCRLGWIPMFFLGISGAFLLAKFHKFQFSVNKNSLEFKLVRYCLASLCGILTGGLANGAQLFNFPQNFYFWLWLSFNLATYQDYVKAKKAKKMSEARFSSPSVVTNLPNMNSATN
jgi:hypothetical protein